MLLAPIILSNLVTKTYNIECIGIPCSTTGYGNNQIGCYRACSINLLHPLRQSFCGFFQFIFSVGQSLMTFFHLLRCQMRYFIPIATFNLRIPQTTYILVFRIRPLNLITYAILENRGMVTIS